MTVTRHAAAEAARQRTGLPPAHVQDDEQGVSADCGLLAVLTDSGAKWTEWGAVQGNVGYASRGTAQRHPRHPLTLICVD
jgi:hypothetical protein